MRIAKSFYERSNPVMGCLFIAQDATAFHVLFFSGAQSMRVELPRCVKRAAEKQKEEV